MLLEVHYSRRLPSISFAYGLFDHGELIGVCTFGSPSSAPLRRGICGDAFEDRVIELNRLCLLRNERNLASFLVGRALRNLPKPRIVISFADTAQEHTGYVYQATNFIYCGLSEKRTDWKLRGAEGRHGQSIADEFRGHPDRAAAMRRKYGDNFYSAQRSRKHRYVYFLGSKRQKSDMLAALRYPVREYPKATKARTDEPVPTDHLPRNDVLF